MDTKSKKENKLEKMHKKIKEWQKNPDFIRAAHEFIKRTTS